MAVSFYPALLEKGPDGTFGVSFPDFPGCVSSGESINEAAANGVEALALHIQGMLEDGEAIPAPSALDAPLPDWLADSTAEVIRVLVQAELPGKRIRVNLTMDEALVARIDAAATQDGVTRSGFMSSLARGEIDRRWSRNPATGQFNEAAAPRSNAANAPRSSKAGRKGAA